MYKIKILLYSLLVFSLNTNAQTKIIMKKMNGIFKIPCKIQDVEMEFILDTGASDVSISLTEALFLIKNGNISKYNLLGYSEAQLANGDIIENTKLLIDNLKIGNVELENIKATIVHNSNAPLLLGQSVLKKLGKIDITGNILTIYPRKEGYYNNKLYDKNKFNFK